MPYMGQKNDELFDLVTENNTLLNSKKPRKQVHSEMVDWHRAVRIFIINNNKQLLCQKRSITKDVDPGIWQPFFGGHVKAGDSYDKTAISELYEETGIKVSINHLIPIHIIKFNEYLHFSMIYVHHWDGSESEIKFKDAEVERVQWMTPTQFLQLAHDNNYSNPGLDSLVQEKFLDNPS
jgi:16S rRNA (adenine1518-N6/adenine1519-N6)-dimethyltransferase